MFSKCTLDSVTELNQRCDSGRLPVLILNKNKVMIKENSVCDLCGNDYHIDLMIPDELWEKHIHKGNFIVMACPHCIINRLSEDNKSYAFKLMDLSRPHPSEREVLEAYHNWINQNPNASFMSDMKPFDRYLAEKQSKTKEK